jgi:short-subunit dehydrogenase
VKFERKIVLITGASSGIGAATGRAFALRGATVVLLARTRPALEDVAAAIRAGGGVAHLYAVDLADLDATAATCAAILREVGTPDIIVNNAGSGRWLSIEETQPAEATAMIALPYLAAFAVTRGFIEGMMRRGSGQVINITSPAAYTPFPGAVAYSVARSSMRAFTNALHADLRGTGVRASLAVFGVVESGYFAHNPGARERVPSISRLIPTLSNEQAAAAIVHIAESGRRRLVLPFALRITTWLWFAAPWLAQFFVNLTGHQRRDR